MKNLHVYNNNSLNYPKIKHASDKSCRENQITRVTFSKFFPRKSCRLQNNVEKYDTAGQDTDSVIGHMLDT